MDQQPFPNNNLNTTPEPAPVGKKSDKSKVFLIGGIAGGVILIGVIILILFLTGTIGHNYRNDLIAKIQGTEEAVTELTCGEIRAIEDGADFVGLIKEHNSDAYSVLETQIDFLKAFYGAAEGMNTEDIGLEGIDLSKDTKTILSQIMDQAIAPAKEACEGKSNSEIVNLDNL